MKKPIICLFIFSLFCINAQAQTNAGNSLSTHVMNFNWMPNGKSICFTAIRRGNDWKNLHGRGIFKINLKTGRIVQLINNGYNPAVSRDGKKMIYTKAFIPGFGGNTDIYLYDFKEKNEKSIVSDTLQESSPSWSPDGKKVVYTVMSNKERGNKFASLDLWVVELSTGKRKQLTTPGSFKNFNPVWAPEGNKIVYYLEKGDNRDQIYLTDEDGSFHTNLTTDTTTHNYYPSWFGRQILYTQSPSKIILMNPDGSQKKIVEDLPAFWAIYNAEADKIAYLTQGSRQKPSEFMIYDVKTKVSSAVVSKEALEKLVFANK